MSSQDLRNNWYEMFKFLQQNKHRGMLVKDFIEINDNILSWYGINYSYLKFLHAYKIKMLSLMRKCQPDIDPM